MRLGSPLDVPAFIHCAFAIEEGYEYNKKVKVRDIRGARE